MNDYDLENHSYKCRCCFSYLEHHGVHQEFTQTQAQYFEILTQIELRKSTVFSNKFCTSCEMELERFMRFRSDAIERQIKLYDLHPADDKLMIDFLSVNIKEEPEDYQEIKECSVFIERLNYDDAIGIGMEDECKLTVKIEDEDPAVVGEVSKRRTTRRRPEKVKLISTQKDNTPKVVNRPSKSKANRKCPHCEKKFVFTRAMKFHIKRVHLKIFDFSCDLCDYRSHNKSGVRVHMKNRHMPKTEGGHICEICGFKAATSASCKVHIKVKHEQNFDFKCPQCNRMFISQSFLNYHLKSAHSGKLFRCPMCDKTSKSNILITEHIAMHHKKIPKFPCLLCDRKCFSKNSLHTHVKYVHANQFVQCTFEGCGKSFQHEKYLKTHIRRNHTDMSVVCDVCSAVYKYPDQLRLHKNVVHLNYRYYCVYPGCNLEYRRKKNIIEHIEKHHTKDPEELKKYRKIICKLQPHVVDPKKETNETNLANNT